MSFKVINGERVGVRQSRRKPDLSRVTTGEVVEDALKENMRDIPLESVDIFVQFLASLSGMTVDEYKKYLYEKCGVPND